MSLTLFSKWHYSTHEISWGTWVYTAQKNYTNAPIIDTSTRKDNFSNSFLRIIIKNIAHCKIDLSDMRIKFMRLTYIHVESPLFRRRYPQSHYESHFSFYGVCLFIINYWKTGGLVQRGKGGGARYPRGMLLYFRYKVPKLVFEYDITCLLLLDRILVSAEHLFGFANPSGGLDVLRMKPIVSMELSLYTSLTVVRSIHSLFSEVGEAQVCRFESPFSSLRFASTKLSSSGLVPAAWTVSVRSALERYVSGVGSDLKESMLCKNILRGQ